MQLGVMQKRKEKKRKEKKRKEKKRKEKKRKEKKRKEKKRLEKTTPFGVNLMRSQVSYRAAQAQRLTSSAETAADCGSDSEAWCACLTVRATAYGCLLQYFSNGFSCDCMVLLQAVQGCFLFIWKSASTYFCRCLWWWHSAEWVIWVIQLSVIAIGTSCRAGWGNVRSEVKGYGRRHLGNCNAHQCIPHVTCRAWAVSIRVN